MKTFLTFFCRKNWILDTTNAHLFHFAPPLFPPTRLLRIIYHTLLLLNFVSSSPPPEKVYNLLLHTSTYLIYLKIERKPNKNLTTFVLSHHQRPTNQQRNWRKCNSKYNFLSCVQHLRENYIKNIPKVSIHSQIIYFWADKKVYFAFFICSHYTHLHFFIATHSCIPIETHFLCLFSFLYWAIMNCIASSNRKW